jgi:diguanylate cyclase (GGDEF)-like protein
MVTADGDGETTVRALKEGANDYVTKPVDFDVVIARLRTHLAFKTENEQLQRRALYDLLTGLPNRSLLIDRLNATFARAERSKGSVALLLLDLDGFKAVNDCHGHVTGDKLLVAVAERLRETARKSDTVGRLGGDEFLVVAEGLHTEQETDVIVARIEDSIRHPFKIDGREIHIGVSIGVQFWRVGDPVDFGILLSKADAAMYDVKRTRKSVQRREGNHSR